MGTAVLRDSHAFLEQQQMRLDTVLLERDEARDRLANVRLGEFGEAGHAHSFELIPATSLSFPGDSNDAFSSYALANSGRSADYFVASSQPASFGQLPATIPEEDAGSF